MGKVSIPFDKRSSLIPIIKVNVGGKKEIMAFVDSGAQICLFDNSLKEFMKSQPAENLTIVGVESEVNAQYVGQTNLEMTGTGNEKVFIPMTAAFSNLKPMNAILKEKGMDDVLAVIGSDFLQDFEAKINYEERKLTLTI